MTDLSFLVNRFNALGTNPYQLAYKYIKHFQSNMAEVLFQKKLPNVNFEFGRPNEASLIAVSLLIERYSALGLQNLISTEICTDIEDYVEGVHANQVGISESDSEVIVWDHFGSVISGQFAQYDLGPNFDRLDSIIESVEDIMNDYIQSTILKEHISVELHSFESTHIKALQKGRVVKAHITSIMDTCLPIAVASLRHMYPKFDAGDMDYIHISGNSILRSSYGDARKQYPHCDSFENDTMSFLFAITDDNAGTEICCQDIAFRCPFNPEDPFGASYNMNAHEMLDSPLNKWFANNYQHFLLADDQSKFNSLCIESGATRTGSALFFTGRTLHRGQPPKQAGKIEIKYFLQFSIKKTYLCNSEFQVTPYTYACHVYGNDSSEAFFVVCLHSIQLSNELNQIHQDILKDLLKKLRLTKPRDMNDLLPHCATLKSQWDSSGFTGSNLYKRLQEKTNLGHNMMDAFILKRVVAAESDRNIVRSLPSFLSFRNGNKFYR
ncbi:hypothetical protein HDU76_005829 [Blyttiomyces sp. JEL0837]|nr:hypothetical protein HDU76_005829 [Blyttiomyces sp. JEL0837]